MKSEEARLKEEIAKLLAEAEATDSAEDAQHGPDRHGDELPEELARRESRLAKIQEQDCPVEADVASCILLLLRGKGKNE